MTHVRLGVIAGDDERENWIHTNRSSMSGLHFGGFVRNPLEDHLEDGEEHPER